eukprot:4508535-Alexandrium_andersonii.AAC.1
MHCGHPGTERVRLSRGRRQTWAGGAVNNPRADTITFSFSDLQGIARPAVAAPFVQLGRGVARYHRLPI